jgi:transposase
MDVSWVQNPSQSLCSLPEEKSGNNLVLDTEFTRLMFSGNPSTCFTSRRFSMEQYFLGIDASKGYADFILLNNQRQIIRRGFQLDDTHTGHQHLQTYLQELVTKHPQVTICAGLESTGGYENNWYRFLMTLSHHMPIKVARLNPAWVKANSKAAGTRNRTDQISAKDVAQYLLTHPDKVQYNESEETAVLRRMWTHIQSIIKQQTQALNQLESYAYDNIPEVLSFCRQGVPLWLLQLLATHSTYEQLRNMGDPQIPYFSKEKREKLLARIQQGVGANNEISGRIISSLAAQILVLDQQIKREKKYLEAQCSKNDLVKLLRSFKGIGVYSAVGLLVYIGNISRFSSAKQLASYFGVHPVFKTSGDGIGGIHMSKEGAAAVRAILYMVALSASRHTPIIRELYTTRCAQGMNKNAALGVCMHKIIRIVFGMLTHNTLFSPELHRKHQEHAKTESVHPRRRANIENRDFDKNAPISRRQNRKRKEQAQSQDEKLVMNGIKQSAPSLS